MPVPTLQRQTLDSPLAAGLSDRARKLFLGLVAPEHRSAVRFVHITNLEAERFWAEPGALRLPSIGAGGDAAIVNRLEETSLFLFQAPDVVILRHRPDQGFLEYVSALGFRPPRIVTVDPAETTIPISPALLASDSACAELSTIAAEGAILLPFARTSVEEAIEARCGLRPFGPAVDVCRRVNSKIYSRRVAREAGLTEVPGAECETIDELEAVLAALEGNPVPHVLKEAMGVSGKGLLVLDRAGRAEQVRAMLRRKWQEGTSCSFVLERWVEKRCDLNYQILVEPGGHVRLLAVKELVTVAGVHAGHRFPASLTAAQREALESAAQTIGRRLFDDGFTGIAGIDAIVGADETLYPLLEINARFNMSTLQLNLESLCPSGGAAWVRHYTVTIDRPMPFAALAAELDAELLAKPGDLGVVIINHATVNANVTAGGGAAKGRLYVAIIGSDAADVAARERRLAARLCAAGLTR